MYLEQQQYLKMIALEYIGCVKYAHLHLFQKLKELLHLSTFNNEVVQLPLILYCWRSIYKLYIYIYLDGLTH